MIEEKQYESGNVEVSGSFSEVKKYFEDRGYEIRATWQPMRDASCYRLYLNGKCVTEFMAYWRGGTRVQYKP